MAGNARLGDIWSGVCVCHDEPISMVGPIIVGDPRRYVNGIGQARLSDVTIGSCGHTGTIITCSATCYTSSIGAARIGDSVHGCNQGIIVSGSPNCYTS